MTDLTYRDLNRMKRRGETLRDGKASLLWVPSEGRWLMFANIPTALGESVSIPQADNGDDLSAINAAWTTFATKHRGA